MIRISGLSKIFHDKKRGQVRALDEVSFEVHPHEVFGLLGPNGAGKTTMLRLLATVLAPTGGAASVAGYDIVREPSRVRASIGFLSGDMGLYARLTPRDSEPLRRVGAYARGRTGRPYLGDFGKQGLAR
jgi:sodium transport system ATP-binding protein